MTDQQISNALQASFDESEPGDVADPERVRCPRAIRGYGPLGTVPAVPPHFARTFRAILGVPIVRLAGSLVVALVLAGGVLMATGNLKVGGSPSPNPTPAPTEASLAGGQMVIVDPGPLPAGTLLYYFGGAIPQEGAAADLRRAYRLSSGPTVVESLTARLPISGQVFSTAVDARTGQIAIGVCVAGYCGTYGWAEPGSEARLAWSQDGGITWSVAPLPVNTSVVGFSGDQIVAHTLLSPAPEATGRVWMFPSGQEVVAAARLLSGDLVVFGGDVLLRRSDGALVDAAGELRFGAPELPGRPAWATSDGLADSREQLLGDGVRWWVGQFEDGRVVTRFSSDEFSIEAVALLSATVAVVNSRSITSERDVPRAALLDLRSGQVSMLQGLTASETDAALAVGAIQGALARVTRATGCLPMRSEPGEASSIVSCLPDGVLLRISAEPVTAAGKTFAHVITWAGTAGWVDSGFLIR